MVNYFKNNIDLFLYFVLSIFTISPLLSPGFFPIHDDTQVARVFEMGKSLSDGMFPVRWVEDLGYGFGYPIFNFYSVLPYYIGGILTVLGIDALTSTKIVFMAVTLASGLSMFLLIKELFGKTAGLAAGIIYLYFPYHAINIYVRGDIAETTTYAFLPLVFLSLFKILQSNRISKKYVVLGSLSIAAVILSHNLSSFMLLIFIGIFIVASLILTKNKNNLLSYGLTLGLAFLLSAFYSIPAILEMKYTNIESIIGGGSDYRDHFICINQLWDSPWGFGGSASSCVDGMSFKLGKLNILLLVLTFGLFLINFKKIKEKLFIVLFSFAGLLFSVFMTLSFSSIAWSLPFMDFLQFPWRFLNFTGLFISVIVGYLIWQFKEYFGDKISITLASIVILFTLAYNAVLFNPKTIHDRESSFYTNDTYLKWTVSKISDEYLPRNFTKPAAPQDIRSRAFDIVEGSGEIFMIEKKTQSAQARVNLNSKSVIRVNVAYFPAWIVIVDGNKTSYIVRGDGLYITLPHGQHSLESRFVSTSLEKASNFASIIGLLGVIAVIIGKQPYFYAKKTS